PLSLVPSLPDEAPFETFDDAEPEVSSASEAAEAGSPFTEGPVGSISVPSLPELESGAREEPLISLDSPLAHVAEPESFEAAPSWMAPAEDDAERAHTSHEAPLEVNDPLQHGQTNPMPAVAASAPALPAPEAVESAAAAERIRRIEQRLEEALADLTHERDERVRVSGTAAALGARLEAFERDSRSLGKALTEKQQAFAEKIRTLESALGVQQEIEGRVRELHDRVGAGEKRLRTSEDDVAMALRSVGERGEKVHQQVASLIQQVETLVGQVQSLETALRDKTSQSRREADDIRSELQTLQGLVDEKIGQGRRESEDIRSQIAPLLEAHGQKGAADDRLARDFDRLRESLAESLGELSERLRGAIRGL
ncbi:MAG TPA: hypothetical protein VIZ69_10180, partial [Thermoanaerobaculia bacterium]